MSYKLTLDDIADLRAYERVRDATRARVIELKRKRRVEVGPFVSLVFECRDTIRSQIQEMARIEKIISDEGIRAELDVYNSLIPEPGELSATLFIELTSKDDLMTWLPQLVGIESAVELRLPRATVRFTSDTDHAARLTREDITASVHYVRADLEPHQIDQLATGPVRLAIDHPAYQHEAILGPATVAELLVDLGDHRTNSPDS